MGRATGQKITTGTRSARRSAPDWQGWSRDPEHNRQRIDSARRSGDWIPGSAGTERPVRAKSGARLLWCWRPATGQHAYLNLDTDIILSDEEAGLHLDQPFGNRSAPDESARRRMVAAVLPPERHEYLRALNYKHFRADTAVGSWFENAESVAALLDIAASQRGSLSGDDRDELIGLGADPHAFMPRSSGVRYLKVIADGHNGLVDADELADRDPNMPVRIVRTKPGAPCSLVVDDAPARPEFVGTVIIGPNEGSDGKAPTTPECVWTAHPGLPVKPATQDIWPEGSVVSVQDVIARMRAIGHERVWLQTANAIKPPPTPPAEKSDDFSGVFGQRRGVKRAGDS